MLQLLDSTSLFTKVGALQVFKLPVLDIRAHQVT